MKKNPASQESERAGSAPEGVKGLRACAGWTDTCCNETPCQWGDHPCERKKPLGIEYSWHSTPQLWCAVTEDYDGAPDAGFQPMGFGKTKEAAIADLEEQIEEHRLSRC